MCYSFLIFSNGYVFTGVATQDGVPILKPGGVLLTRLVIGVGVHVTQVVAGLNRLTVHMDVYADILVVNTTLYLTLMVII